MPSNRLLWYGYSSFNPTAARDGDARIHRVAETAI
jgi:hypothetical protein